MGFLKLIRNVLLLVVVIALVGFAVLNPGQRAEVDLWMLGRFADVPLVEIVFIAFVLGVAVGLAFSVAGIVELQSKVRDARRSGDRLQGELTSLRNLPIEEADEEAPPLGTDS